MRQWYDDSVDSAREYAASRGKVLELSPDSLPVLEELLDEIYRSQRKGLFRKASKDAPSEDQMQEFARTFGGYLGEVVRTRFGGEWQDGGSLRIDCDQFTVVFPCTKVLKRMVNGREDDTRALLLSLEHHLAALPAS